MPIYEYRCRSCGHELEKLQRMGDAALTDCPSCGVAELQRLVSAAGFRLKGAGWYETDFKQGQKRNLVESGDARGEGKKEAPKTKSSDADSSASKPAAETGKSSGDGATAT
jgi:putative FmdB family regulatory protein